MSRGRNSTNPRPKPDRIAELRVGGMTCAACVATIETHLMHLRGVSKASVNLVSGMATVEYDGNEIALSSFCTEVDDIGFDVEVLSASKLDPSLAPDAPLNIRRPSHALARSDAADANSSSQSTATKNGNVEHNQRLHTPLLDIYDTPPPNINVRPDGTDSYPSSTHFSSPSQRQATARRPSAQNDIVLKSLGASDPGPLIFGKQDPDVTLSPRAQNKDLNESSQTVTPRFVTSTDVDSGLAKDGFVDFSSTKADQPDEGRSDVTLPQQTSRQPPQLRSMLRLGVHLTLGSAAYDVGSRRSENHHPAHVDVDDTSLFDGGLRERRRWLSTAAGLLRGPFRWCKSIVGVGDRYRRYRDGGGGMLLQKDGVIAVSDLETLRECIEKLPGVLSCLSSKYAVEGVPVLNILYDSGKIGARHLVEQAEKEMLRTEGLAIELRPAGSDMGIERLRVEHLSYLRSFLMALIPTVMIVYLSMSPMESQPKFLSSVVVPGISLASFLMFLCATPVHFVFGWRFHSHAFSAMRRGFATMDLLISLSTNLTYFFSVFSMLYSFAICVQMEANLGHGRLPTSDPSMDLHIPLPHFFETSAVLITAVLLGKSIETRAKLTTHKSINRAANLQAKECNLVIVGSSDHSASSPVGSPNDKIQTAIGDGIIHRLDRRSSGNSNEEDADSFGGSSNHAGGLKQKNRRFFEPTMSAASTHVSSSEEIDLLDRIESGEDLGIDWTGTRARLTAEPLEDEVTGAATAARGAATHLSTRTIPTEFVHVNDLLMVRCGETVPTDGVIEIGDGCLVDESLISGESRPVQRDAGGVLLGGSKIVSGVAVMKVSAVGSQTFLGQVQTLVEAANSKKAPVQLLADRVARVFVPFVLLLTCLTWIVWAALVFSGTVKAEIPNINPDSIYGRVANVVFVSRFAIAVLSIACPCALGLATPTAVALASGRAAELGILVKNIEVVEKSTKLTDIVFDKTGTLTVGHPTIARIILPESSFRLPVSVHRYPPIFNSINELISICPSTTAGTSKSVYDRPAELRPQFAALEVENSPQSRARTTTHSNAASSANMDEAYRSSPPRVDNLITLEASALLWAAGSLQTASEHTLARSIVAFCSSNLATSGPSTLPPLSFPSEFKTHPGRGVEGFIDFSDWLKSPSSSTHLMSSSTSSPTFNYIDQDDEDGIGLGHSRKEPSALPPLLDGAQLITKRRVAMGNWDLMLELRGEAKVTGKDKQLGSWCQSTAEVYGETLSFVMIDNDIVGCVTLTDGVKRGAEMVVRYLQNVLKVNVWMCTGDGLQAARKVAEIVGIDEDNVRASMRPQDKADFLRDLRTPNESGWLSEAGPSYGSHQQQREIMPASASALLKSNSQSPRRNQRVVGMVGDGINDASALAVADVGVAIGAGSNLTASAADAILVHSELIDLLAFIKLCRVTALTIKRNFIWAILFNCIGLPVAAGILYPTVNLPPVAAGILMAGSSVVVILNSLLLRLFKFSLPSAGRTTIASLSADHRLDSQGSIFAKTVSGFNRGGTSPSAGWVANLVSSSSLSGSLEPLKASTVAELQFPQASKV